MQLTQLPAILLLLFSAGWLMAGRYVGDDRRAAWHWAVYGAIQALAVTSTWMPPDIARVAASALPLAGFIVALRGVEVFASGRSTLDRWYVTLFVCAVGAYASAPAMPLAGSQQRIVSLAALFGGVSLLLIGTLPRLWQALRVEFGPAASAVALSPNVVVGIIQATILGWSVWVGPLSRSFGAERVQLVTTGITIFATTLFNLCFAFLYIGRLVRRLRHSVGHDHLTAIANRRSGQAALAQAHERHRRDGEDVSVLMIDLDHFKRVNDEQGHAGGDRALVFAAATLRQGIRPYDTVARWGGEEFIVVMPGLRAELAFEAAERLRTQIEVASPAALGHRLTASIGVATACAADTTPDALVARADRALYQAKNAGRNRTAVDVATGSMVAPGVLPRAGSGVSEADRRLGQETTSAT